MPTPPGSPPITVRPVQPAEHTALGQLLVEVYGQLAGFPSPTEQPAYYQTLAEIGRFTERKDVQVLVAVNAENALLGGVVYFGDMAEYGAGGIATEQKNAAGFRLLGVRASARGLGVGKALTQACLDRARSSQRAEVILHTTQAMQTAWAMYERFGFQRSPDLDFLQQQLPVFGFRLRL